LTRIQADLLLLFTAIIWGCAFVAQKTGMDGFGPYGFVFVRYILAGIIILPFAWWELSRKKYKTISFRAGALLCVAFAAGVITQQIGIQFTSIANAGFLTGLYVLMTPLAAWALFRHTPSWFVFPAAILAVAGTWFLNGGTLTSWNIGDAYIIVCAVCLSVHIAVGGYVIPKTGLPITYTAVQLLFCAMVAAWPAFATEGVTFAMISNNWLELAYTVLFASVLGFSLQFIAQQHTPSSDTAIILSSEAVFAAMAGALLLGEKLTVYGWIGCGLVAAAILLVEVAPLLRRRVSL
jgi:drug/metabolite transporter (DMT)-like permease